MVGRLAVGMPDAPGGCDEPAMGPVTPSSLVTGAAAAALWPTLAATLPCAAALVAKACSASPKRRSRAGASWLGGASAGWGSGPASP